MLFFPTDALKMTLVTEAGGILRRRERCAHLLCEANRRLGAAGANRCVLGGL